MPAYPKSLVTTLHVLALGAACACLGLHFVHLAADFPNFSAWMDWSKYTDEGWYGDAAIRHFQLGHWYVPGDFNPAAALPVWPLLEALVFRFTGVSLVAARALTVMVFAATLIACWLLVDRWRSPNPDRWRSPHPDEWRSRHPDGLRSPRRTPSLAASASVLLLAASPFCFVFTRMAILEPLLVLLTVLALLTAGSVRPTAPGPLLSARTFRLALRRNLLPMLALGLLLPALVLTKTTGLFLVPAVAWLLLAALEFRMAAFLRVGVPSALLGLLVWLAYFGLVVRPHFLLDYRYLFSANAYTGITRATFFPVLADTLKDGFWMGNILYPLALAAAVWTLAHLRRLRAYPLPVALLLWAGGYAAFLAYHDNLQPRYYLVVAVPLTLLVPVVLEQMVLPRFKRAGTARLALAAAGLVVLAIVVPDARQVVSFVRHPEYTLLNAARNLSGYIAQDRRQDPKHNPLLLSISGSDISLMTGLPSIDDDFGTLELADRVKQYRPGWYAAWNQIDDDKMDAITPLFQVERVAAFPAMDDPSRNLLILYRLDPAEPGTTRKRRKKPTPRKLQTKVGQQPSVEQLEH